MLRMSMLTGALVALFLAGGCVGRVGVGTSAYVSTPDLVYVSPGVYVVADQADPIFYTDGYYWMYSDGYWLRSHSHYNGWARVRTVPYHVRGIRSPRAYVRYRASGRVYTDRGGRRYYRNNRAARPGVYRQAPRQRVRDHREERRDDRRDRRNDRRRR